MISKHKNIFVKYHHTSLTKNLISNMSQAKLISECFVRPKIEVDESKRVYHLTPVDFLFMSGNYAQLGFVFMKTSSFNPSSHIERLRSSLSQALVHFYPLAGRLETVQNVAEHSCLIYLDCKKGPGARLIHASAPDSSIVDVVNPNSVVPKMTKSFFDLGEVIINHDGHTAALLSVQLTELRDGVFLGICFNHVVLDGISSFHFLRVWSNIFMGTFSSSISLPVFDRPAFLQGRVCKLPYLDPSEFIISRSNEGQGVGGRYFSFSPQSLKLLKATANSQADTPISTFKALIAFAWKCITRARNLPSDDLTICAVSVDIRPHFNPPLTSDYYGNYAVKARGSAKVGDLVDNNIGWAAMLLQQAISALDDKAVRAIVLQDVHGGGPEIVRPTQTSRPSNISVGGSPLFDMTESDFGLGRLVAGRAGYGNKVDGKVNAYYGNLGDGSVDLAIYLAPHAMAALLSDQEFMHFAVPNMDHLNLTSRI